VFSNLNIPNPVRLYYDLNPSQPSISDRFDFSLFL